MLISKQSYAKPEGQVIFITKDKPCAARTFKTNLLSEIGKIPERYLSYRKSTFFEEENKREIIFKRYRIEFEIKDSRILVFGF